MQNHVFSNQLVEPRSDPHALVSEYRSTTCDPPNSEVASNPSEYEDDGYMSADSMSSDPKISARRRRSKVSKPKLRLSKDIRPQLPQTPQHVFSHQNDEDPAIVNTTTSSSSHPTPSELTLRVDTTALNKLWELLETWYSHKGQTKRPPCAVEQSRLDQLHSVGTRENTCQYLDRQGRELKVTSCPLKGWEFRGLHIIIAFRSDQDAVIIRDRGKSEKESGNDTRLTKRPFYIWRGISGDEEGWESEPSIYRIARCSNPTSYEPINLKRRRLQTPRLSRSGPHLPSAHESSRKVQPLLSKSFPGLFEQLVGWIRNDLSKKTPAFVLNTQPDLYVSKAHPEKRISYVDIDGNPVEAGLFSLGVGNQHVIVAHGSTLEPAIISFDSCRKLPKYYTAYYKWISSNTWIQQPCVFKVFGDGPYELPRIFVDSAIKLAQIHPMVEGSDLPERMLPVSETSTVLPSTLPTSAEISPSGGAQGRHQDGEATPEAQADKISSNDSQGAAEASRQGAHPFCLDLNAAQSSTGTRKQPILVPNNPFLIKGERSAGIERRVSPESRAKSVTFSSTSIEPPYRNQYVQSTRAGNPLLNIVQFRFLSEYASRPRERPFAKCNNVKMLFSNAKLGGLLEGRSSISPLLAFHLPGASEPIKVLIGDNEDFEELLDALEKALITLQPNQEEAFVVEVRPDHLDESE